jgi:perosamine synthetase
MLNLYFSALGASDACALVRAWLLALAGSPGRRRALLEHRITNDLQSTDVLLFGSARSALFACLKSAGIGKGDQVLVTGFTCLAVPLAVVATGGEPVYVDIDPQTLNAAPSLVRSRMGSRVKAVIIQHTFGCPAMVEEIVRDARERGIVAVEDCALAIGSSKYGRPVGTFGDAAVFSLELSKTITTGWGGLLVLHDERLQKAARLYYESVREPSPLRVARMVVQTAFSALMYHPRWFHACRYLIAALFKVGIFRPSTPPEELNAAVGTEFVHRLSGSQAILAARQWDRLPAITSRIDVIRAKLCAGLRHHGYEPLAQPARGDVSRGHRIAFLVSDKTAAVRWFAKAGIELGTWFDAPVSPMPEKPERFYYRLGECPQAEWISRHIVNLPAHVRLTDGDVTWILETLGHYRALHPADANVQTRGVQTPESALGEANTTGMVQV